MTKEAKIGLLVGLVFIVSIAIVLRDVHQNGQADMDDARIVSHNAGGREVYDGVDLSAVTRELEQDNTVHVLRAEEQRDNVVEIGGAEGSAVSMNDASRQRGIRLGNYTEQSSSPVKNSHRAANQSGSIESRHSIELPREIFQLRALEQGESIELVQLDSDKFEEVTEEAVHKHVEPQKRLIDRGVYTPVKIPTPEVSHYVVKKGDSLSSIAIKYYGKEEGNRLVNINKIFNANKETLKSKDDIFIGQKLVIPALNPHGVTFVPQRIEPKKEDMGTPAYKWYTVRKGDSLWKIAESQLGSGKRYLEIARLNSSLMEDQNAVYPGMKIKLPK